MKKKLLVVIIIIACIVSAILIMLPGQKSVINTALSARSQEYLENRGANSNSSLQHVDLDKAQDTSKMLRTVGNCFRFTIPFRVGITRFEKTCEGYFQILNPNGRVLAYTLDEAVDQSQMSGVSFRRQNQDVYSEEAKAIGDREFLIFTRKDTSSYDKNVYYHTPKWYFVLNLSGNTTENLDEKLFEMLGSVEFLKK